jgi:hypothetical protein
MMDGTGPEERAWVEQWRTAAGALAELRREQLGGMSEAAALEAAERLLALTDSLPLSAGRRRWSGLVEQQALLHRRRVA